MAFEQINRGTTANDGTGDPLREAYRKVNDNFDKALEKDTTEGVERVYTINPDGSQATKPTSEFGSYTVIAKNVVNSSAVTGTTATTTVETFVIPANTFQVGDIIIFRCRLIKTGTAGVFSHRHLFPSWQQSYQTTQAANIFSQMERFFIVKSGFTEEVNGNVSASTSNGQYNSIQQQPIDWSINHNLEIRLNLGNATDSAVVSFWELSRIR